MSERQRFIDAALQWADSANDDNDVERTWTLRGLADAMQNDWDIEPRHEYRADYFAGWNAARRMGLSNADTAQSAQRAWLEERGA